MKAMLRRASVFAGVVMVLALSLARGASAAESTSATTPKPSPKEGAPPMPTIKVGDVAPDFTLRDHMRHDVTLSAFRGKKQVVLAFYVFAFTGG